MARDQMKKSRHLRIGIDTGGTFTDVIALQGKNRLAFKLPSTPTAPAEAIVRGICRVLEEFAPDFVDVGRPSLRVEIVHGTTVATNAMLERKGSRTALISTEGFADLLEIGRQARPDLYNLAVERPAPLVPRELRFGLSERISPNGLVLTPLDDGELARLRRAVVRAQAESVAISLLFSFANPVHERRVVDALEDLGIPVSASHEILPEYREYERTSTVVINAYLAPLVGRYLKDLQTGIARMFRSSVPSRLRIMQSSGGSISAQSAAREPVRTILSGPAGGVVAALRVGELAGIDDLLTFDMGGTSTDVALCRGAARTTNEARISGLPVAVPVLDIHTVGAGGGSIARVDTGGALRVGPESAGADPGPACYGRGELATVTDANLVLGRFGGQGLLAGEMKLDAARAGVALDALAAGMSRVSGNRVNRYDAALGVIRVANANMEKALRLVSIERGHDPRRFTLVSFGGAGGLHCAALADALQIPRVLIPADPGNFSALGVLLADVVKDHGRTVMLAVPAGSRVRSAVAAHFRSLEKSAFDDLHAEGFAGAKIRFIRSLAMRYRGQSFELDVPFDASRDPVPDFHQLHRVRYGHADPAHDVEIVSVRLRGVGVTDKPQLAASPAAKRTAVHAKVKAQVRFRSRPELAPVYDRGNLEPGDRISGPAIILEYGSTTLVPGGWQASVDRCNNLLLQPAS